MAYLAFRLVSRIHPALLKSIELDGRVELNSSDCWKRKKIKENLKKKKKQRERGHIGGIEKCRSHSPDRHHSAHILVRLHARLHLIDYNHRLQQPEEPIYLEVQPIHLYHILRQNRPIFKAAQQLRMQKPPLIQTVMIYHPR